MTATEQGHVHPQPNDRLLGLITRMVAETSDTLRGTSDPLRQRALDQGLDELVPLAREMSEEVGEVRARGLLEAWMVEQPQKTAGLFAAALVRLAAGR